MRKLPTRATGSRVRASGTVGFPNAPGFPRQATWKGEERRHGYSDGTLSENDPDR
jgi:hypothetical protein